MGVIKGLLNNYTIKKVCRICLEVKGTLHPFSTEFEICIDKNNKICATAENVLLKVINESFISNMPNLICNECMNLLKAAYIFKLKYDESTTLLSYFLNSGSVESCDNNENIDNVTVKSDCVKTRQKRTKNIPRKTENVEEEKDNKLETVQKIESKVMHPCPICTVELPALELREHARTHKTLKKYITVPQTHQISEATRFIPKTREGASFFETPCLHKCPYCNVEFTAQQFRLHVDLHRKQDEFSCDKCNRVFRKLNHLNTHRIKHMKEYPYKCEHCGKGFVIKTNYECHILTHTPNELPHECSYCYKRFSNPEHLKRHQFIHTETVSYSVKYKVCRCHSCLKTFRDKTELKKHTCEPVQQPVNTKFPCRTCKKVFKNSSALYNHNKIVHKMKSAKILCSACGNYVSNINTHMMKHTGEKPYQCNQCDKRFSGKPQLRQHLLVHSGLKPYVCSVCAKAFNNLYNLQVHERIHKGDKCHICHICNKGFLEKSYLKKHMNVHKDS